MRRLEIIGNHSVREDLFDEFRVRGVGEQYTLIPSVHGVGNSGPRMGDHVWPEENFLLIVYCEDREAAGILEAVAEVKKAFPEEGLKAFDSGR